MTRETFKKQLNNNGQVELIIKVKRPDIGKIFIEKYKFKKFKNGIIKSYLNDIKEFETNSINHIYFIYGKALNHKEGCKGYSKYFRSKKNKRKG